MVQGHNVYNLRRIDFRDGGEVERKPGMTKTHLANDSVLSWVEEGQLIIPKMYNGKPLAQAIKQQMNSTRIKAIVQPDEIVIRKEDAPLMIEILKRNNIFLPNT
jgi:hypothetical protein